MRSYLAFAGIAWLLSEGSSYAATITLQFVPQEKTDAPVATLPDVLSKPCVKLNLEDVRAQKARVESFTLYDDRAFALHVTGDVATPAYDVLERTARQW